MGHVRSAARLFVWDRERGRLYPVPAGAEGEGDPPGNPGNGGDPANPGNGGGDPGGDGGGDEPKTLTQAQLTAMLTREKNQGRNAALAEAAETLGVPIEEAKSIIEAAKAAEEAQKTEAQRARDAADAEKAKAEVDRTAAVRERHEARVERALIRAGLDPDAEDYETRLNDVSRLVNAEVGAELDAITTEVTTLKERYPDMFSASGDGGAQPRRTPSSDPPGRPPKGKPTKDALSRGAERAKQYGGGSAVKFDPTKAPGVNA